VRRWIAILVLLASAAIWAGNLLRRIVAHMASFAKWVPAQWQPRSEIIRVNLFDHEPEDRTPRFFFFTAGGA